MLQANLGEFDRKTKEVEARGRGEEGRRALLSHALGVVAGAEPRVWFALRVEP